MKRNRLHMSREIWDLVSQFFTARAAFQETYDNYEARVLAYAAERGVDRTVLRLDAHEVSGLLDFKKLERLRDDQLDTLKIVCHNIFRHEKSTDILDRYVSEIYHELSILKEEQYKVERFAPAYLDEEREEYDELLDEVHEAFPRKVHHIYDLFQKAQRRLETVVSRFSDDEILLRSAFLFGDDTYGDFYPGGTDQFFESVFPEEGPARGYLEVARSFADSGFESQARDALEQSRSFLEEEDAPENPRLLAQVRELEAQLDETAEEDRMATAAGPEAEVATG